MSARIEKCYKNINSISRPNRTSDRKNKNLLSPWVWCNGSKNYKLLWKINENLNFFAFFFFDDGGVFKKIQFSEKLKKRTPGLLFFFTWLLSFVSFIFFVHIYSSFWIKIMTVWNLVIFGGHDESNFFSEEIWGTSNVFTCELVFLHDKILFAYQRMHIFCNIFQSAMTFPRGLQIFIFTIWRVV